MASEYVDSDYIPTSSSTTSLSQEPWNKVQSSYAAKRKKMQEERMRHLKDLEEQVKETTDWNQRRKDYISSSSRRPLVLSEELNSVHSSPSSTPSSPRSRQSSSGTNKIDLGDATLEDLEGLIAASAKRLASYRLRTTPKTTDPQPLKKNEELERWKELLDHNTTTPLNRLSTTKHYNSDPLESTDNGDKSPSASYVRLRNMFETTSPTLLSSKATERSSSLAELANHRKASTSSQDWKKKNHQDIPITTTRSTIANATPKMESPRISASTTPRASSSHLRKATRSHHNLAPIEPESVSKSTEPTTRSRKLSTLASLQQRQRQNHLVKTNTHENNTDIKTVDDYMTSIKKTSTTTTSTYRGESSNSFEEPPAVKRKVKLSITHMDTNARKVTNLKPIVNTAVRRKRGKVDTQREREKRRINHKN